MMKVIRFIIVLLALPWILFCGLFATVIKLFFGLLTGKVFISLRFLKYLWWGIWIDLEFFIKTGHLAIFK